MTGAETIPCPNGCIRFGGKVPGHVYGSNWPWVPCQTCMGTMRVKKTIAPSPLRGLSLIPTGSPSRRSDVRWQVPQKGGDTTMKAIITRPSPPPPPPMTVTLTMTEQEALRLRDYAGAATVHGIQVALPNFTRSAAKHCAQDYRNLFGAIYRALVDAR